MSEKNESFSETASHTGAISADQLPQNQQIRHVHSHPLMSLGPPDSGSRSLGNLPQTEINNSNLGGENFVVNQGLRASNATMSSQSSANKHKTSPDNRSLNNPKASSVDDTEDENEDGAHDTITSLAGAKMLQRYRRAISGSTKGSATSLSQQHKLEDLFLIEEDIKDIEADELEVAESTFIEDKINTFPITAEIFVPPDGGYGWLIAFGAFNALFWTAGMVKSYGVIFDLILKTFPNSSVALASWIPASMTTLALAMAPFTSALCQRYNCRNVTFIGSLLCFIGITLSSFASSVEILFVTFGLLTGIGIGMSTTPGIILVARYFDKRRGIANAFCLSGTAAGSLCLPFLMETLVHNYAFSGTLLILGSCMLHISISAALYRPLGVHVQITNKKSPHQNNVVKLTQASEDDIIMEQQHLLNKEIPEHQNHMRKLQNCHQHLHHHMHHHNHHLAHDHNPEDVVERLHMKLESMAVGDDISIHSSASQENHQHRDHHNQQINSQQHTPHHQLHHHGHGLGFRNSFTSMAVSLPPDLDHHYSQQHLVVNHTPNNGTSTENLQCQWHCSELPKFDIRPQEDQQEEFRGDDTTSYSQPPKNSIGSATTTSNKPMSLSTVFVNQLESRLTKLFGGALKKSNSGLLRNNASFVSIGPSISRQHSTIRKKERIDSGETCAGGGQTPKTTNYRRSNLNRSTLDFIFEDIHSDSTSVLKDRRHPSLSSVNLGTFKPETKLGRVVSFNRSHSQITNDAMKQSVTQKRTRYISEGHHEGGQQKSKESLLAGSRFFVCAPSDVTKSGSSLCVSLEMGLAGAATPISQFCPQTEVGDVQNEPSSMEKPNNKNPIQRISIFINKYIDLSLVKEPIFIMMVISVMTMSVGVPHVLFFIPTYLRKMEGSATLDPAVLLCATSISDLVGRIAFGFLLDANFAPKHLIYACMILSAGVSVIVLGLTHNNTVLIMAMLIYGLGAGAWFLMVPLLLAEYLGVERIGSSYGLIRLFQAISNLIGPVIGGILSDFTGSFAASFTLMGSLMTLGAIPVLFKPMISTELTKCSEN